MARVRHIVLAIVLAWSAAGARAQQPPDDPVTRARTHFEAGRALYQLGNYHEALREFAAGYELAPRPQFLLNLGQCYRKLDDLERAHEMYQRYLHDAPPTDPERPQAEQILREIDRQLAARATPQAPPSTSAPAATGAAATGAAAATSAPPGNAAPAVQPATSALTATAPPPGRSWVKRNWWVFPVAAVVVGVAVGVGVYYGTRAPDPCSGANLACWDLSK